LSLRRTSELSNERRKEERRDAEKRIRRKKKLNELINKTIWVAK